MARLRLRKGQLITRELFETVVTDRLFAVESSILQLAKEIEKRRKRAREVLQKTKPNKGSFRSLLRRRQP